METENIHNKLSIAPMIDWTYSAFRVFMRILAPNSLLYTEMLTADAIIHNQQRSLYYQAIEQPLAIQLGGSDKHKLAAAAIEAQEAGFTEVNLNLGCPSDRVQSGRFGACLMRDKLLVADCIKTMRDSVQIPVTAKVRIGIDEQDSYEFFREFVDSLLDNGCEKIIVHARKAWLKGLSPKQNRTIPKINYDYVYRLKSEYPEVPIVINGDIKTIDDIAKHLSIVDGVMLGRLAYENPYAIAMIHKSLYADSKLLTRREIINKYLQAINFADINLNLALKPLYNLYHSMDGAKSWKQKLMRIQQTKDLNSLEKLTNDTNEHLEGHLLNTQL